MLFGAVISTIVCILIFFKHKPVKKAQNANEYVDKKTVKITKRYDHFVNHTLTKTPIGRK